LKYSTTLVAARGSSSDCANFRRWLGLVTDAAFCGKFLNRLNPLLYTVVAQPIMLCFDHAVTLANVCLQSQAINNLEVTARVANKPLKLQALRSMSNAFTPYAQHMRQEFLGH